MRVLVENGARKKHLDWVKAVMRVAGWNQTRLAREAGIDPSTLSKFLRGVNPGSKLEMESVEKIEALGIIPAFETEAPEQPRGFAEQEAVALIDASADGIAARAVKAAKGSQNGLDAWVLQTDALVTAGFNPGDIMMVDQNAEPQNGDVVLAQIIANPMKPLTVFRLYEEPYLVAASHDPQLRRPLIVGRDPVMIRGVVVASIRPRRAA